MKITIQYKIDHNSPPGTAACCAYVTVGSDYFCGWANSFDEAERRLMAKLKEFQERPSVPEPKEVEI